MKIAIDRDSLLKPLQMVAGVVERRQTLPILSNVLLCLRGNELILTGTDLEIELQGRVVLEHVTEAGAITVPARKLMDICRALPEKSVVGMSLEGAKLNIRAGRSRFNLATLPAEDFPNMEESLGEIEFSIAQNNLRNLIEKTQFAVAQQDVRYYLNGMLFELYSGGVRTVGADGHRLALSTMTMAMSTEAQIIVPRKGIQELTRLLSDSTDEVVVLISAHQLRVKGPDFSFTTKLIDSRYPDFSKAIPREEGKVLIIDRDVLRQTLNRVAVLSSEKHRAVRFELHPQVLRIVANNPEQEEAEDEISVDYHGGDFEIAFNVNYLLDAVGALPAGSVKLTLAEKGGVRIEAEGNSDSLYVVMPMQL